MRLIKTIVVLIARSRVVYAKYLLSNQFLIARSSCTRANVMIFCRHSIIHLTLTVEVSLTEQDSYFAAVF